MGHCPKLCQFAEGLNSLKTRFPRKGLESAAWGGASMGPKVLAELQPALVGMNFFL